MAAKRYRNNEHRTFHRAATYTEGRSIKRSRDERALKRKSTWGKVVAAGRVGDLGVGRAQALLGARAAGPLPRADRRDRDPDGVDHRRRGHRTAARADPAGARAARVVLRPAPRGDSPRWSQAGIVHGDLSAYNILAAGDRLVIIDLPQIVDLVGNPQGMDFLLRDCTNVCGWFRSRGSRGRRARPVRRRDGAGVLTGSVAAHEADARPDGRHLVARGPRPPAGRGSPLARGLARARPRPARPRRGPGRGRRGGRRLRELPARRRVDAARARRRGPDRPAGRGARRRRAVLALHRAGALRRPAVRRLARRARLRLVAGSRATATPRSPGPCTTTPSTSLSRPGCATGGWSA